MRPERCRSSAARAEPAESPGGEWVPASGSGAAWSPGPSRPSTGAGVSVPVISAFAPWPSSAGALVPETGLVRASRTRVSAPRSLQPGPIDPITGLVLPKSCRPRYGRRRQPARAHARCGCRHWAVVAEPARAHAECGCRHWAVVAEPARAHAECGCRRGFLRVAHPAGSADWVGLGVMRGLKACGWLGRLLCGRRLADGSGTSCARSHPLQSPIQRGPGGWRVASSSANLKYVFGDQRRIS